MSLDEHDRLIAYVLGLSHAVNIAFFTALAGSGERAPRLVQMSSTTFDAQFDIASAVAEESADLYFEIQRLNEYGAESLDALAQAVDSLRSAVQSGDQARFTALMHAGREYTQGRQSLQGAARLALPAQQQQEYRRADQRGDGPDRQLRAARRSCGWRCRPGTAVRHRTARHRALPGGDRKCRSASRTRCGATRPTKPTGPAASTASEVSAAAIMNTTGRAMRASQSEDGTAQLAGGQHVERAARRSARRAAPTAGGGQIKPRVLRPAQIARQPEHHAAQLPVVGDRQQHRNHGSAGARQHHARKQQPARIPAAPHPVHQCTDGERTAGRGPFQCRRAQSPRACPASAPTEAPPETPSTNGSASGLRNRACSSTPASPRRLPDRKGGNRARQPDRAHDRGRQFIAPAAQRRQRLAERQMRRAGQQRSQTGRPAPARRAPAGSTIASA